MRHLTVLASLLATAACTTVAPAPAPLPAPVSEEQLRLRDEWRHVIADLNRATKREEVEYAFPTEWASLSCHGRRQCTGDHDPTSRRVRERLRASRTTVSFGRTSLSGVAEFLGRVSGTRITVDPFVAHMGENAPITLRLDSPGSVDKILDLVTIFRGLAWRVRDGGVRITTLESVRGDHVVRVYDVKDLATTIRQFPGEEIHCGQPTGEYFADEDD